MFTFWDKQHTKWPQDQCFTFGLKKSHTDLTGAAVMIPHHQSGFRSKVSDSISVHCFGVKLGCFFLLVLEWAGYKTEKKRCQTPQGFRFMKYCSVLFNQGKTQYSCTSKLKNLIQWEGRVFIHKNNTWRTSRVERDSETQATEMQTFLL